MSSAVTANPWSEEALFAKALIYVGQMESHPLDEWKFGFWSALSLELLARAALAHISPVLLAEMKNWRNLTHALGHAPTAKKYSPISISTTEVFARLAELVPAFTEQVAGFCTTHSGRRNSELHSGELAFTSLGTSHWLPRFHLACKILLESMGKDLSDFVEDAKTAQEMIDSLEVAAVKAVKQDVSEHREAWSKKTDEERGQATARASAWATRKTGHRVTCPACGSQALVWGKASGAVSRIFNDEEVIERQTMLPSTFECIACGLHILGLSKLSACGLGDAFTAKSTYPVAEFFGLYTEDDLEEARGQGLDDGDDFNEY
jgi:hypothetical protein